VNIPYPEPPIFHSPPIQGEQPSVTFHQPENLIYQNSSVQQHPPQLTLGPASTQQGPTVSFHLGTLNIALETDTRTVDSIMAEAYSVNLKIFL
jgi:hypothetical protein